MSQRIPIYTAEREAGLAQTIASPESCAISVYGLAKPDGDELSKDAIAQIEETLGQSSDNFDLYPVNTILVTTGWNNNDDIFDRTQTWAARYSPEDKPFNLGHNPNKIIGHITGSRAIDTDYSLIPDDTVVEELPDKFHILTSAVIYRHISGRDKELTAEMAELIEGIQSGEWFVSMEVLFGDFDYGLIDVNGHQQVIARREETAFLTKHLRRYKGSGKYQNYRIGRVLKGMTFSGKGLVEEPANPESVILNDATAFKGALASLAEEQTLLITVASGENSMNEELLKEQNNSLQRQVEALEAKLSELDAKAVKEKLDTLNATIEAKDGEIAALQGKLEEQTASNKELAEARETAEAATADVEQKLSDSNKQLEKIAAEAKQTERVSALVDKGVDKAEAETLVEKFSALDDEQFSEVVAMQAELVEAKKSAPASGETEGKQSAKAGSESEESSDDDETSDRTGEAAADANLDNTEEEEDADLSTGGETEEERKETATAALSDFIGGILEKSRKKRN